jgi:hypothetical protein
MIKDMTDDERKEYSQLKRQESRAKAKESAQAAEVAQDQQNRKLQWHQNYNNGRRKELAIQKQAAMSFQTPARPKEEEEEDESPPLLESNWIARHGNGALLTPHVNKLEAAEQLQKLWQLQNKATTADLASFNATMERARNGQALETKETHLQQEQTLMRLLGVNDQPTATTPARVVMDNQPKPPARLR